MKHVLLGAGLAVFALPQFTMAQSVEFSGASVSYYYGDSDDDYAGATIGASAELSFGAVGVQLDIGQYGYDGDWRYSFYGAHLIYNVSNDIAAGVYFIKEDDMDSSIEYTSYGIEAAYTAGPVSVQAAIGEYEYVTSGATNQILLVDGNYAFTENYSAFAGFTNSKGSDDLNVLRLGGRYDRSGFFAEAGYSMMSGDYDHNTITIEIGYEFGGGTTFDRRDWSGLYGLY